MILELLHQSVFNSIKIIYLKMFNFKSPTQFPLGDDIYSLHPQFSHKHLFNILKVFTALCQFIQDLDQHKTFGVNLSILSFTKIAKKKPEQIQWLLKLA